MKTIFLSALVSSLFSLQALAASVTCQSVHKTRSIIIHSDTKTIEFIDSEGSASVAFESSSTQLIETIPSILRTTYKVAQYDLIVEFPSGAKNGSAKMIDRETGAVRMVYPSCAPTAEPTHL